MKKVFMLVLTTSALLLSGCSAVESGLEKSVLEKSGIQESKDYILYEEYKNAGMLDEKGQYVGTRLSEEKPAHQDAPEGKIKKSDVTVAKNYLSQDEMKQLNRMVTAYLDFAENMTLRHIPLTMQDWEKRLNSFIEMFDYGILQDAGKVSAEIAKLHAETEFEKYRVIQDRLFMSDFDKYMLELEENTKK